ncbi:MAG TPA: UDP-N-acetylmuramate--L-alanine ligase [Acidimicrobiia bacterium]|nr:UDP-N-acetylmuramate--L-alanine ligase [Acidimicrobiia bacterium]
MTFLEGVTSVHLVGVGGAGMSGLAKILAQSGHTVSGSDIKGGPAFSRLHAVGVECWAGHRPDRAREWDLVVASSAVPEDRDPELLAAKAAGIEVWERPALLAEMTRSMPALGLSGSHGKTTSSALTVAALRALGRDPSFMVGGQLVDLNTNAHLGERDLFVLEADEAYGTFLDLTLDGFVVTSIEPDHLNYYRTFDRVEEAFRDVARRCGGPVVVCLDDAGSARLARDVESVTYGTHEEADWRILEPRHDGPSVRFTLEHGGDRWPVSVSRPGLHIARNATGVLALLGELGMDVETAAEGLSSFAGVRRRFEVRARLEGITVIDDYAHHPTEIAATIAAARLGEPQRIVAIFQPHHFWRTADLATEFGEAMRGADVAIVAGIYAPGEPPIPGVTSRLIADAAESQDTLVRYVPRRIDLAPAVAEEARPGDLVLFMGAGDITLAPDELATLLAGRSR